MPYLCKALAKCPTPFSNKKTKDCVRRASSTIRNVHKTPTQIIVGISCACANVERREWITSLSVRIIALLFFTSFQFPFVFTIIFGGSLLASRWFAQLMSKCFSSVLLFCLPWLGLYKLFTDRLISTGPRPMQHALIFGSQGPTIGRGGEATL